MIKLQVDEAYAFDYLAILYIKKDYSDNNYRIWKECERFLQTQYDSSEWDRILNSEQFQKLIDVNRELFHAVEAAKQNKISAKDLDDQNMQRFYSKQVFQNVLFPNKPITETKII